jgi:hypothetical protein
LPVEEGRNDRFRLRQRNWGAAVAIRLRATAGDKATAFTATTTRQEQVDEHIKWTVV